MEMLPEVQLMQLVYEKERLAKEWERDARHRADLALLDATTTPAERDGARTRLSRFVPFGRGRRVESPV
jgi:hypothetical protein